MNLGHLMYDQLNANCRVNGLVLLVREPLETSINYWLTKIEAFSTIFNDCSQMNGTPVTSRSQKIAFMNHLKIPKALQRKIAHKYLQALP